ncbi:MAG: hypothetical protein LBJ73_02825 [Rickettsiales bacterium]|jgi:hypothetical protein|nr:hypothetical protein [Rickettsiales bacterium]
MKKVIIGIWDKKAEDFIAINMDTTIETAIRQFRMACEDENSLLFKFPEDYEMKLIQKMEIDTKAKWETIAEGIDYKPKPAINDNKKDQK